MHPIFEKLQMIELNAKNFDSLLEQHQQVLVGIFFWGHDCPNCEVAKKSLLTHLVDLEKIPLAWFHVNTYENFELGTRFGLHGIPTFLFFYQGKKLGKISPYPGIDPFLEALNGLVSKLDLTPKHS